MVTIRQILRKQTTNAPIFTFRVLIKLKNGAKQRLFNKP